MYSIILKTNEINWVFAIYLIHFMLSQKNKDSIEKSFDLKWALLWQMSEEKISKY
jgi:hypothetical protein